jgi:hypothetical protein
MNRWSYFHPVTFLSYVRRLSDKHKLYSSAINIYSSILSDEHFPVFCSDGKIFPLTLQNVVGFLLPLLHHFVLPKFFFA